MAQENPRRRQTEDPVEEAPQEKLMKFDGSNANLFDVILVVGDEKFYVSKMHLAQHSPSLHNMFFGPYAEKSKKEIELGGVDPNAFQKFLELINGLQGLTDENVEGVLEVSGFLLAETAKRSCETFIIEKSQFPLKRKLENAVQYELEGLKNHVLSNIKTKVELNEIASESLDSWNLSTTRMFLQKTLEICKVVPLEEKRPSSPLLADTISGNQVKIQSRKNEISRLEAANRLAERRIQSLQELERNDRNRQMRGFGPRFGEGEDFQEMVRRWREEIDRQEEQPQLIRLNWNRVDAQPLPEE